MVELNTNITLAEAIKQAVSSYVAITDGGKMHAILDDKQQSYAVVFVPQNADERPTYVIAMARLVDGFVIIDEDGAIDKPLHQALMVNAQIPREQIILAYQGETMPTTESA